ncbi:MAG: metallophosphoesterase family protein [Armatimonadota bacterium]
MRFVQFSDCHLGSAGGGALALSDEKKAELRQDIQKSLAAACRLAHENHVDMVLIPGDVFDFESLTPEITSFLVDVFGGLKPAPVFIAPGNHDSLRAGSPYLPGSNEIWPENVRVFTSSKFESISIPELDCSVTGIAHSHRGIIERLLSSQIPRPNAGITILLFHGSREGFRPVEKENVIPFSDAELAVQGFTYAAIGHYHSFSEITDSGGRVIGAYSGCIQGRGLDETGQKVAVIGEIGPDGSVDLSTVEVGQKRVVSVEVNITGAGSYQSVRDRVGREISAAEVRPQDIVNVVLTGNISPGLNSTTINMELAELCDQYFHVRVDCSRVLPDCDIDALLANSAAASLRSDFARRMLERKRSAQTADEIKLLDYALYLGLSALDNRPLEPRDVD